MAIVAGAGAMLGAPLLAPEPALHGEAQPIKLTRTAPKPFANQSCGEVRAKASGSGRSADRFLESEAEDRQPDVQVARGDSPDERAWERLAGRAAPPQTVPRGVMTALRGRALPQARSQRR